MLSLSPSSRKSGPSQFWVLLGCSQNSTLACSHDTRLMFLSQGTHWNHLICSKPTLLGLSFLSHLHHLFYDPVSGLFDSLTFHAFFHSSVHPDCFFLFFNLNSKGFDIPLLGYTHHFSTLSLNYWIMSFKVELSASWQLGVHLVTSSSCLCYWVTTSSMWCNNIFAKHILK